MTNAHSIDAIVPKQAHRKGGYRRRLTTHEFIARAIMVHGSVYDYSFSKYINSKTKISIICAKHGVFEQSPDSHLKGSGCVACYKEDHYVTQKDFVLRATAVHGDSYDYSNAIYKGAEQKVKIYCKFCEVYFYQAAICHMSGQGCSTCARIDRRITQEAFVIKSEKVHGSGSYCYSKSVFIDVKTKVDIKCNSCNSWFEQIPADHMRGRGCKPCGDKLMGYSRSDFKSVCNKNCNGYGLLYVIKCQDEGKAFYKIGITSRSVRARFGKVSMPYHYDVLYEIEGKAEYIYNLEKVLHRSVKENKYMPNTPFKGHTECFTTIKPIERLLNSLSSTDQLQLLA